MENELTPYQHWQMERFSNIITDRRFIEEYENGLEEEEKSREWCEMQADLRLQEEDYYYL